MGWWDSEGRSLLALCRSQNLCAGVPGWVGAPARTPLESRFPHGRRSKLCPGPADAGSGKGLEKCIY